MTDSAPVLLVLPRWSWDALVGSRDSAVHLALESVVQVDTRLNVGVRLVGGVVDDVFASVHLDAVKAVANRWAVDGDVPSHADVVVRSVPVVLTRPEGVP